MELSGTCIQSFAKIYTKSAASQPVTAVLNKCLFSNEQKPTNPP